MRVLKALILRVLAQGLRELWIWVQGLKNLELEHWESKDYE